MRNAAQEGEELEGGIRVITMAACVAPGPS